VLILNSQNIHHHLRSHRTILYLQFLQMPPRFGQRAGAHMKSITSVLVVMLACAAGYGCTGLQRFIHGDPVVSGAPEINDNVFLLRHHGLDEDTYTDTGKVVPYPCLPFMHNAPGEKKEDKSDVQNPDTATLTDQAK